ncbi:MAG: bifunctional riboflavin kinase/FAD synthetase [Chitinophagales bacterium]
MRVFRDLHNLPSFHNSVVTIGTFDGVHRGHQKIIDRIKELAREVNGESIIITFHPHPRLVINPGDKSLRLLNTIEEKIDLLAQAGIDNVVIVPFSRDFSEQSAEDYIHNFLVKNFAPQYIVIGYDHRFGKNREGNFLLLEKMKEQLGYKLEEITKETLDDIAISSTKIRQSLAEGEIKLATELLGHSYTISGMVVRGLQNGRKLGYPTANIQVDDEFKLIPRKGVYTVRVKVNEQWHGGMMSIGFNPTFEGKQQTIEVNIFDFDADIYGNKITVEFIHYIRDEKKFNSLDDLIAAIKNDEVVSREILLAP